MSVVRSATHIGNRIRSPANQMWFGISINYYYQELWAFYWCQIVRSKSHVNITSLFIYFTKRFIWCQYKITYGTMCARPLHTPYYCIWVSVRVCVCKHFLTTASMNSRLFRNEHHFSLKHIQTVHNVSIYLSIYMYDNVWLLWFKCTVTFAQFLATCQSVTEC